MPNQSHAYRLKTLSPIFIGGQSEQLVPEMDYLEFPQENCLAILDNQKLGQILKDQDLDAWVKLIDNLNNRGNKGQSLMDLIKKRVPKIKAQDLALRIISLKGTRPKEDGGRIRAFSSSLGQVYIPGSSLKGSLRTLLLNELIKQNPSFVGKSGSLGQGKDFKGNPQFRDDKLQAHYLGKLHDKKERGEVQEDLLRLIRIGDAHFSKPVQTVLYQNNIFNLRREDWEFKKNQKSYYECIPQGWTAEGRLHLAEDVKKLWSEPKHPALKALEIEKILGYAKEHTSRLLKAEIEFWEDEGNPYEIEDYLGALGKIKDICDACGPKQAVLRIGAGSGWDFMTGAWAKEDGWVGETGEIISSATWENLKQAVRRGKEYQNTPFPKTRKILSNQDYQDTEPLGFVLLTID